jgi:DNA-binding NarL/FixJ family response regulator
METLRILLVDDHALFLQGIKSLLDSRPGIEVVGTAGDGCEAITLARQTVPDVILMDIAMPRCSGLEATRQIKREFPHVKIVILTVAEDEDTILEAIKSGAEGYLLKNLEVYQLYDMLEGLRRGEAPLSGSIAAKILNEFTHPAPSPSEEFPVTEELSERECQVLELIVEGKTNKEIAEALFITENTVKTYLGNILAKLHLQNRIQAAVYAVSQGMVEMPHSDRHPISRS